MSPIPRSREAQMLLNFAIFSPNTSSDPLATRQSPSLYPADRLTDMQSILAALADLETAYEIEREQIEQGPGSEGMKQHLLADLEDRHQARCELFQEQWEKLNSRSNPAQSLKPVLA
jgi:hypothetical protein